MCAYRIIAFAVLLIDFGGGMLWLLPIVFESHYIRLQHKSPKYYAELAAACDSISAKYPMGTNAVTAIPVKDPSLPAAIRALHPLNLKVSSQRVWMLLDSNSRAGIGL